MKVYTRTGDDGSTGLFYGGRVPKDSPRPWAYGTVDEAQAQLGVARALCRPGDELDGLLTRLCHDLYVLMAELATLPENRAKLVEGRTLVTPAMVEALEADDRRRLRPLRAADRVRHPRADPARRPARPGPHGGAKGRAAGRPGRRRRLAGRPLPEPPLRPVLDARPLAGGRCAGQPRRPRLHRLTVPAGGNAERRSSVGPCRSPSTSPTPHRPRPPPIGLPVFADRLDSAGVDPARLEAGRLRGQGRADLRAVGPDRRRADAGARRAWATPSGSRPPRCAGPPAAFGRAVRRHNAAALRLDPRRRPGRRSRPRPGRRRPGRDRRPAPRPLRVPGAQVQALTRRARHGLAHRAPAPGAEAGLERGTDGGGGRALGPRPGQRAGRVAHARPAWRRPPSTLGAAAGLVGQGAGAARRSGPWAWAACSASTGARPARPASSSCAGSRRGSGGAGWRWWARASRSTPAGCRSRAAPG